MLLHSSGNENGLSTFRRKCLFSLKMFTLLKICKTFLSPSLRKQKFSPRFTSLIYNFKGNFVDSVISYTFMYFFLSCERGLTIKNYKRLRNLPQARPPPFRTCAWRRWAPGWCRSARSASHSCPPAPAPARAARGPPGPAGCAPPPARSGWRARAGPPPGARRGPPTWRAIPPQIEPRIHTLSLVKRRKVSETNVYQYLQ
jgi:hypothetical protein